MIIPSYTIETTPYAQGKGVIIQQFVRRGQVVVAPDKIDQILNKDEIAAFSQGTIEDDSCIRWFESHYTTSPDWPDDCYVNHSFEPTGLWHLGFIFANRDLHPGDELTVDYQYLIDDHATVPFLDAATGRPIVGLTWKENIRTSTQQLLKLLNP